MQDFFKDKMYIVKILENNPVMLVMPVKQDDSQI